MNAPVLVINCGSSSIKYALVPSAPDQPRLAGLAERLGSGGDARLKGIDSRGESFSQALGEANHTRALEAILDRLERHRPVAVGHRIVHGGERFTRAALIDDDVVAAIEQTSALAPLHNPANLEGVAATRRLFPDLPQVAVFDTAFHQTLPARAYRYALPEALYRDHAIRRYGFHGTSHAYVSRRADALSGLEGGGWLTAHLGNGCSTCAVWQGRSLDTSMGLTPLEGVAMGTRSGDVDPGLHAHLSRQLGWSLERIDEVLNRNSGLLGLSGLTNDMRELEAAEKAQAMRMLTCSVAGSQPWWSVPRSCWPPSAAANGTPMPTPASYASMSCSPSSASCSRCTSQGSGMKQDAATIASTF